MIPQIAHACIIADYQERLESSIQPSPDIFLWGTAKKSTNSHYLEQIGKKVTHLGLDRDELSVLDVTDEEFASMWPERPDVTDTWPMAMLAKEKDGTGSKDLTIMREITRRHLLSFMMPPSSSAFLFLVSIGREAISATNRLSSIRRFIALAGKVTLVGMDIYSLVNTLGILLQWYGQNRD
jgi:hypothetical protein